MGLPVPAFFHFRDWVMLGFLRRMLGLGGGGGDALPPAGALGVGDLARRLGITEAELRAVPISYFTYQIPKRRGGVRTIRAPSAELKALQRRILHRLLRRLRAHECATGFERGHSIVTNALPHVGQEVVVRLDLRDFFPSITARRVEGYFRRIGWDAEAAALLTMLCTYEGSLPQGAPTSPRLSNLVNHQLDARLCALAAARGAVYSRYADDMTLSWSGERAGDVRRMNPKTLAEIHRPARFNDLIHAVKAIVEDEGYRLHTKKKLRIARRHDRQVVTGLVVNEKVNLPRKTRRWLRAVEHHVRMNRPATLSAEQVGGWRALQAMIDRQSQEAGRPAPTLEYRGLHRSRGTGVQPPPAPDPFRPFHPPLPFPERRRGRSDADLYYPEEMEQSQRHMDEPAPPLWGVWSALSITVWLSLLFLMLILVVLAVAWLST
jgi:RNA-directed DNA polymerase